MFCERINLKSGQTRWRCIKDAPPCPRTGRRRQIERRGKTQREAKKKVEDAINALKDNNIDINVSKRIKFKQVAKDWLKVYRATGVKDGSVRIREKEIN